MLVQLHVSVNETEMQMICFLRTLIHNFNDLYVVLFKRNRELKIYGTATSRRIFKTKNEEYIGNSGSILVKLSIITAFDILEGGVF